MQIFTIKQSFFLLSFAFVFQACSSKEIVNISEAHLYNDNYGLNPSPVADAIIEQELLAINKEAEISSSRFLDLSIPSELKMDTGTFLAENYVEQEPIITYKYKFDSKFYTKAEWRSRD